jgi:hypothetical protein
VAPHRAIRQRPGRGRSRQAEGAVATNARAQAGPQRQGDHRRARLSSRTFGAATTSWRWRSPPTGDWRSRSTSWSWRSDPKRTRRPHSALRLAQRNSTVRGPCWRRPLAARAPRPGSGSPAAGAPATLEDPTNSGGRAGPLTANAGPSHGPIEFTTSASACPQRGRGAAIRQESEPGGDPPKPPGAASPPGPTTARGVEEPTAETMSGNRNRRSRFHRPDAIPRRLPCLE